MSKRELAKIAREIRQIKAQIGKTSFEKKKLEDLFIDALKRGDEETYQTALELQEATGLLSKREMETYLPIEEKVNLFQKAFESMVKQDMRYTKIVSVHKGKAHLHFKLESSDGIPDQDLNHYNGYIDEDDEDWVDDIMDTDFPYDFDSAVDDIEDNLEYHLRNLSREYEHMLKIKTDLDVEGNTRWYSYADIEIGFDLSHPF